MMEDPGFSFLQITGDVSVEPLTSGKPLPYNAYIYLLMGPTGAGKSSFIEALAGDSQKLSISSNQLAGYTQTVTAYQLVNAEWGVGYNVDKGPVYLVDTPGFCDSKISEVEVMDMVRHWLKEHQNPSVQRIVYFTPITDTRLAGSRRRTLEMLEQFLVTTANYGSVILAATMWDTLSNERTRNRAESNFSQLIDEICNDSSIYYPRQFMNTRTSALQVLDCYCAPITAFFKPVNSTSPHHYRDLHERIEGALQKKLMVESDLNQSDTRNNTNLKNVLEQVHKENDETLAKFISQLVKFGEPPDEFREGAQVLRETIVANFVPANHQIRGLFQLWADEPGVRTGLASDVKLTDTVLAMLTGENVTRKPRAIDHRPSRKLDFNGLFRRLLKSPKIRCPKWLKREE